MARTMPPGDQAKVGQFIGRMLRGIVSVNAMALPMVSLYNAAKESGVSIIDLALEDEDTMRSVVEALGRRAGRIPPPLLKLMERVVADAKQRQEPLMVPVGVFTHHPDDGNDDV